MAPSALQHRRNHNLLLASRLLDLRDNSSPFTLVTDSVEQSGRPLVREFIRRAHTSGVEVIYISFETVRRPKNVTHFLQVYEKPISDLTKTVEKCRSTSKTLIIIDSLYSLTASSPNALPELLSSFINATTSLLAVLHTDVPVGTSTDFYGPPPLELLRYLSTTLLNVLSLAHVLATKTARDRSLAEPNFGRAEGEGIIVGEGANDRRGIVFEMEYRRKSGRSIRDTFFLPSRPFTSLTPQMPSVVTSRAHQLILLEDLDLFKASEQVARSDEVDEGTELGGPTFNLDLTAKQRQDREGVVLPYFDAQNDGGVGEGGRILYDMGQEDDFDEEEDEI
ncbi:MAG: hypothetical protein M1825_003900 [Sarcosagium campestre]|nr:MAG: hypothetical protein M1825_003900 [Sarcosagium campestre]